MPISWHPKIMWVSNIRKTILFLIVAASGGVSNLINCSCLPNLKICQLVQAMHMGFIFFTAGNWRIPLEQVMSEQCIVLLTGVWWQLHGFIIQCTSLKALINNTWLIFLKYLIRQLLPSQIIFFWKSKEELGFLLHCM